MRSNREINDNELKNLQIDILKNVHNFCEARGIKYSLAFGTLLGAVRHGGYIPWDDDIDIMMPRHDYEIFLSTYRDERYNVIYFPKDKEFAVPYAKVIDTKTILYEHSTMKYPIGVNIDVFPVDNCPPIEYENSWFKKKQILNNIYTVRKLRIDSERQFIKNAAVVMVRILTLPLSLARLCKMIQSMATQFINLKNPERKAVLSTGDTKRRWMISSPIFEHYKKIKFEKNMFCSIDDTDAYLKACYGNYLELPPEDKRISHHGFNAYWK